MSAFLGNMGSLLTLLIANIIVHMALLVMPYGVYSGYNDKRHSTTNWFPSTGGATMSAFPGNMGSLLKRL